MVPFELIARDQMFPQFKPLFTGVQLSPLSVDRNTPPPEVGSCKNVAAGIDRQCSDIGLDHALINLDPAVSVIRRTINAAGTADKISSYENVTIALIAKDLL